MAFTYSKLAEVNVGSGGASSIVFNNIPQNYTDLILKGSFLNSGGSQWADIYLNGLAETTIDLRHIIGDGNTAASQAYAGGRMVANQVNAAGSSTFASSELYIPNYTSSNEKSMSQDGAQEWNTDTPRPSMTMAALKWNRVTAITNIVLFANGGSTFQQHSSATLYGVKAEV